MVKETEEKDIIIKEKSYELNGDFTLQCLCTGELRIYETTINDEGNRQIEQEFIGIDSFIVYDFLRDLVEPIFKYLEKFRDLGFSENQLYDIREAFNDGINLSKYVIEGFDRFKIMEILIWRKSGLDVDKYVDSRYTIEQMKRIRWGLQKGIPVDKYADIKYNEEQMLQILLGLEKGINVDIYADENYSWEKMQNIRVGLEKCRYLNNK